MAGRSPSKEQAPGALGVYLSRISTGPAVYRWVENGHGGAPATGTIRNL